MYNWDQLLRWCFSDQRSDCAPESATAETSAVTDEFDFEMLRGDEVSFEMVIATFGWSAFGSVAVYADRMRLDVPSFCALCEEVVGLFGFWAWCLFRALCGRGC